ncbi:MAG: alpha/beta hydrolase [Roseicyclus sp.]|nr:alpha/beta hydrolase [Roseicyclus sp.]MBO6624161.1 alpha/beta hydrolase [Roseicyclus sp.]MBO6920823.1 alpha/beta hydrolase [Roseicyclus sp.]
MIWLLALLVLGLVGGWLAARLTQTDLATARTRMDGQLIKLSDGKTHFAWHGPEDGRVMVCIHGLSTPSYVWNALLPHLTAQGYRVLTYDLYGRGLSDRVPGPQTREFFMRQLRDLLASQEIDGPVTLCGYSMGGTIATARVVEAPDQVSQLILVAAAGLRTELGWFADLTARLPLLGDWLHGVAGPVLMNWELARTSHTGDLAAQMATRMQEDVRVEGTMAAILSATRNVLSEDMAEDHRLVAQSGVPVLAIWGSDDEVIPIWSLGELSRLNPAARQVRIDGADHRLVYTHAARIAEAVEQSL